MAAPASYIIDYVFDLRTNYMLQSPLCSAPWHKV